MVWPVNSMSMGPLHYFICSEVSFFIQSNTVWNILMVGKAFCKSMDSSLGRSIVCKEEKSISRLSVFSSKNKMLLFPWWKQSNVVNLSPGSWLITPGNGAIPQTCWSLLLADWALSSGQSQVDHGESMLLSSCIAFILSSMASLFMNLLGDDRSDWGKILNGIYRKGHLIYMIIEILLCWAHPLLSIYMAHRYLFGFAHSERSIHILFLQTSLTSIFQSCFFQVPDHPVKPLVTVYNYTSGHCFFQAKWTIRCTARC